MTELTLQELRKIQLDLLLYFKDFCDKNNIPFFICNGTLLGAVKYQGYIPWDDDIDVFLLRKDYERLLDLFTKNNVNENYKLLSFEIDENCSYPFAKMMDRRTKLIEKNVKDIDLGVNIDVFPIDNVGNSVDEVRRGFDKMEKLRQKLNWSKLNDYSSRSSARRLAKKLISARYKLLGTNYYCKKIISLAKSKKEETNYIGNYVWGFYGPSEALPRDCFSTSTDVSFEGITLPAPIGYDTYLRGLYGDYWQDPPPEKQKTHHSFKAYMK